MPAKPYREMERAAGLAAQELLARAEAGDPEAVTVVEAARERARARIAVRAIRRADLPGR